MTRGAEERSWRKLFRQLLGASLAIVLITAPSLGPLKAAHADEAEEPPWIISHQVEGNLAIIPDSSLPQWAEAHHGHAESLDGVEMGLMSVHNETYIVFLIERSFNLSISMVGVSIFINGTAFNSASATWGWVGGQSNSTDPSVESAWNLGGENLTVVFGRPLVPASGSEARFAVGELYDEAVKVTSWNNGTVPASLDFTDVHSMGLELLPPIDLYPKTPLVYSAVILLATLGFILLEARRYR